MVSPQHHGHTVSIVIPMAWICRPYHVSQSHAAAQSSGSHGSHHKHQKQSKPPATRGKNTVSDLDQSGLVDFLFVVTQVQVSNAYAMSPDYDCWSNLLPPRNSDDLTLTSNTQDPIYRYKDGNVFDVSDSYTTYRDHAADQSEFMIFRVSSDPQTRAPQFHPCETYSEGTTVFHCGLALPAIILDADILSQPPILDYYDARRDTNNTWKPLCLLIDGEITRINTFRESLKYVAPAASWIPSIIPELYRNLQTHVPHGGHALGGDFAVIIGLMALGQAPDQVHRAFSTCWRGYQWLARHTRGRK